MLLVKTILLIFIAFNFIGCVKKVNVNDYNKKHVSVDKTISTHNDAKSNSTKNAKKMKKRVSYFNKSIALRAKLKKCGVKYSPWKDRVEKDLILLPKVLSVCKDIKRFTDGYVLHSTKQKKYSSFTQGNQVFLKYSWSSSQIKDYLSKLQVSTASKSSMVKQKKVKVVEKDRLLQSIQYTEKPKLKVLTTGTP